MQTIKSAFLTLAANDYVKAFIVAVLSPVLAVIGQALDSFAQGQPFILDPSSLLHIALTSAAAYLVKQLFTNSQGQFLKSEPPKV